MADKTPLDELQWKNPEWIQAFGLHTGNVLEYFSESPFFDRRANNQTVKMQMQFQAGVQMDSAMIEAEMKKLTGLEYVILTRREPDFWILRKQNRLSPDRVEPLADYFIIGANVYQAPTAKDIVSSRLLLSALSMKTAIDKLQSLSQFTPSDGHTYKTQSTAAEPTSSRSRTLGNTPYTPATPTVSSTQAFNKNEQLSTATMDNLFNISLNGAPKYIDGDNKEELDDLLITPKPLGRPTTDEESINSVKKGKRIARP